jgi:uncharacterized RmlC-like cupin family protein
MAKALYDRYFLRGGKPGKTDPFSLRTTAYLDDDVIKGSFFYCAVFMDPKYSTGIHSGHTHPYPEILLFHGLDPDDPYTLGSELEIHMGPEFELHLFDKTTVLYIPAAFPHCPIIHRMKKPCLHVYSMTGPLLVRDDYLTFIKQEGVFDRQYDKYFVRGPKPGEIRNAYKNCTAYVDDDVIPGTLYSFATAFVSNDAPLKEEAPHQHAYGEVLGFFGINPEDKFNLGAEIEFRMGEKLEKHNFNQSTIAYIPPGLTHCLTKCKANRPFIFVECANSPRLTE